MTLGFIKYIWAFIASYFAESFYTASLIVFVLFVALMVAFKPIIVTLLIMLLILWMLWAAGYLGREGETEEDPK